MHIQTLLAALEEPPIQIHQKDQLSDETNILALAYDSRKVVSGTLFIAVPGTHTDGRRFLSHAAEQGAIAALGAPLTNEHTPSPLPYIEVSNVRVALANLAGAFYNYPTHYLHTIGVTGTDGKTTTSNLISHIFEFTGKRVGMMTTANFKLAGQEWENTARQSTLEALEIQEFLRRLLDQGGTHAVIETTSHGLELSRVHGCAYDVAVVTNITHEHLDFHGTIENYRRAKARLFEMLDPEQTKTIERKPAAILNRDDKSYDYLKPYCRVPIIDYGIETDATVRAVDLELHAHSTSFHLILPEQQIKIETPLVGRFNVSNTLAAIAVAYSQGISLDTIAAALANVPGVAGRMEKVDEGQPFSIIVDYAHTADSLSKVLDILRPLTPGKLIVVFGSAGERDRQKRPIMGNVAAQKADFIVLTDEDPRNEDREQIIREIANGVIEAGRREGEDFLCIADRRLAIAKAIEQAEAGDTILLAGKGHEQSIIIGREKIPWDDRQVARDLIRKQI